MLLDKKANAAAYWKENIRYLLILLTIWFVVSLVVCYFTSLPPFTFRT